MKIVVTPHGDGAFAVEANEEAQRMILAVAALIGGANTGTGASASWCVADAMRAIHEWKEA